ncbi:MAG: TetR/AcrR family transcriptional regulator, partial [Lachnospiraceae bacterium]|nr:TetR/AcrR family transcriptional regulator [Lachnospiraceae bacterium]
MPRDKTLSHERVKKAVKEEFLEKGFEDASIRSIGARAGMTSAGLYRHYADKEAMFNAMVEPLIESIKEWTRDHASRKYDLLESSLSDDKLFGENFVDMVKEVILPRRDEFILLISRSAGTKYENFVHDYVE